MRSGRAYTHRVDLSDGEPDGDISWSLHKADGTLLGDGTITPADTSVSVVISVPGGLNTLESEEFSDVRELSWSYTADSEVRGGEVRYTVEKPIPFPATPQGVRNKLGVEKHELEDDAIPLMDVYLQYRESTPVDSFIGSSSRQQRLIANALEALAGLSVLPTLQIRIAAREQSDTNAFNRYSKVDWSSLRLHLEGFVAAASAEIAPALGGALFIAAGPEVDPITGE